MKKLKTILSSTFGIKSLDKEDIVIIILLILLPFIYLDNLKKGVSISVTVLFLYFLAHKLGNSIWWFNLTTKKYLKSNESLLKIVIYFKSEFDLGSTYEQDQIFSLSKEINNEIEKLRIGSYDGNEFGNNECTLFIYGNDMHKLSSIIEKIMNRSKFSNAYEIKYNHAIKRTENASS